MPLRVRIRILGACEVDRAAVCPGMPPGGGRIPACLTAKPNVLSPRRRTALAEALRWCMIPKSGSRFSKKIMRQQNVRWISDTI
jgi:hypothetical protein